jgi:hypothetical protein
MSAEYERLKAQKDALVEKDRLKTVLESPEYKLLQQMHLSEKQAKVERGDMLVEAEAQLAALRAREQRLRAERETLLDAINSFGSDADRLDSCLLRLLRGDDCRGEANGLINGHAVSFSDRSRLLKMYGRSVDPAKTWTLDGARAALNEGEGV